MIIVASVKIKVVILAVRKAFGSLRNFGEITGRMSRVITAAIVFTSDEVIPIVAANNEATTRPIMPWGRIFNISQAYDSFGFCKPGKMIGAAHIGKNNINGQNRYKMPDSLAALDASFSFGEEIYLVARLQMPPL